MLINEADLENTIAILRDLKDRYRMHHGVNITDPTIIAATKRSRRYITDRQLPDKAIRSGHLSWLWNRTRRRY